MPLLHQSRDYIDKQVCVPVGFQPVKKQIGMKYFHETSGGPHGATFALIICF